jgi:hypothetical protein
MTPAERKLTARDVFKCDYSTGCHAKAYAPKPGECREVLWKAFLGVPPPPKTNVN